MGQSGREGTGISCTRPAKVWLGVTCWHHFLNCSHRIHVPSSACGAGFGDKAPLIKLHRGLITKTTCTGARAGEPIRTAGFLGPAQAPVRGSHCHLEGNIAASSNAETYMVRELTGRHSMGPVVDSSSPKHMLIMHKTCTQIFRVTRSKAVNIRPCRACKTPTRRKNYTVSQTPMSGIPNKKKRPWWNPKSQKS